MAGSGGSRNLNSSARRHVSLCAPTCAEPGSIALSGNLNSGGPGAMRLNLKVGEACSALGPLYCNWCVFPFSSVHFPAFRKTVTGPWYVQVLIDVLSLFLPLSIAVFLE